MNPIVLDNAYFQMFSLYFFFNKSYQADGFPHGFMYTYRTYVFLLITDYAIRGARSKVTGLLDTLIYLGDGTLRKMGWLQKVTIF